MPPRAARAPAGKSTGAHVRTKVAKSLREVYEESCREKQVHSNSAILSFLPERQGASLNSDTLDVTRNYLGDHGIAPLLSVVERSPALRKLIVVENGLRNNAIRALCAVAARHPHLTSIDVSDNFISEGAGIALLKLVEENPRIVEMGIRNTKIDVDLRLKILSAVERNVAAAGVAHPGAGAPTGAAAASSGTSTTPAAAAATVPAAA